MNFQSVKNLERLEETEIKTRKKCLMFVGLYVTFMTDNVDIICFKLMV